MLTKDDELAELLSRCTLRDQQAFKALYDKASPFLNSIAYRILRSEALCSEVLQDSFVQIWNNAESYRQDQGKAITWMCGIVRYRAIDKLRVERKHNQRLQYAEESVELDQLPGNNYPDKDFALDQLRGLVHKCLDTLGSNTRRSMQLAYLQDYSREEIAELLGTNVNTVKSWLFRGARKLKENQELQVGIAD